MRRRAGPPTWSPAPLRARRRAARGEHRPRGGAPAPRSSRSQLPTGPRPGRSHAAARSAHVPRCRPRTSDGDGCRPSSSGHTTPAGPATATPSGSATAPRSPPADGPSTGEPCDAPGLEAVAREEPTLGQSGRSDHAHVLPTSTCPRPLAGHAPAGLRPSPTSMWRAESTPFGAASPKALRPEGRPSPLATPMHEDH